MKARSVKRANLKCGHKYDHGKARWDLMPFAELDEVAQVLAFGAEKYSPNNWKIIKSGQGRYFSAALRHASAIAQGEQNDQETGLSHYSHAVCSLLFAHWHARNGSKL